jgi:S1-C subfamily serine protease
MSPIMPGRPRVVAGGNLPRPAAVLVALAFLAGARYAAAQDNPLPLKTLNDTKAATVFLKVTTPTAAASGTGFVIRSDAGTVHVVTNHHVVDPSVLRGRGRPGGGLPTITAVFGSGTAGEQSLRADVVAADARHDLAVLRVVGVANPPAPLDLGQEPRLVETMPVFIFGFPLGDLLATGKRHPAITVGRGSVSSIRLDEKGRLATVQVNGDVTPGNSGGPVVDGQGRLVGVAVATVRDRQIGFTIPAADRVTKW